MDFNILKKLQENRSAGADFLNQIFIRNVKERITNQYDQDAHFIYEVIQNANDAAANKMAFILTTNCIIILHNGSRDFSVTDPTSEEKDTKEGKLGDLNSLLSIGNSNKTYEGNKIGKFGCGFKSVFMYTDTPYIFNKELKIKIVDYISFEFCTKEEENYYREMIRNKTSFLGKNDDYSKQFSTIMILPFNKKNEDVLKAYNDIYEMLYSLKNPVLFLDNLKIIETISNGKINSYNKTEEVIKTESDIELSFIKYSDLGNQGFCWKLSRETEWLKKYSVVFASNEDRTQLIPINHNFYYCYFETRTPNNKQYLANGSFELNPSRTNIKDLLRNEELKNKINELAIDSLRELSKCHAYGDEIINFYPCFIDLYHEKFLKLINSSSVIPCGNKEYETLENSVFVVPKVSNIFTNEDVKTILKIEEKKFVFPSISNANFDEKTLGKQEFKSIKITFQLIAQNIDCRFMQDKLLNNPAWLENLYEKMTELSDNDYQCLLKAPLFLINNEEWVPYSQDIYINEDHLPNCKSINEKLMGISAKVKQLLENLFSKYSWKDYFCSRISLFKNNQISINELNEDIIIYYKTFNYSDDNISFLKYKIDKINFIKCKDGNYYNKDDVIYFNDSDLDKLYPLSIMVDREYYIKKLRSIFTDLDENQINKLINSFFYETVGEYSNTKLFKLMVDRYEETEEGIDKFNNVVVKFYDKFRNSPNDLSFFNDILKNITFIKCKNGKYVKIGNVIYIKDENIEKFYPCSIIVDKAYYKNMISKLFGLSEKQQINKIMYNLFNCLMGQCHDSEILKILIKALEDKSISHKEFSITILHLFEKFKKQGMRIETIKEKLIDVKFVKNKNDDLSKMEDVVYTKDEFLYDHLPSSMMADKVFYKNIIKSYFLIGDTKQQTIFLYEFLDTFTCGGDIQKCFMMFVKRFTDKLITNDQFNIILLYIFITKRNDKILVNHISDIVSKVEFIKCKDGTFNKKSNVVCTDDPLWLEIYPESLLADGDYFTELVNTNILKYAQNFAVDEFIETFITHVPYRTICCDRSDTPFAKFISSFNPEIIDVNSDFRFRSYDNRYKEHTILGLDSLMKEIILYGDKLKNHAPGGLLKQQSIKVFNVIKYFIKKKGQISETFYLEKFESPSNNFSISGFALYPIFLNKNGAFMSHSYQRNLSELNDIYDYKDLNIHQIAELADFLKMNNDFMPIRINQEILDDLLEEYAPDEVEGMVNSYLDNIRKNHHNKLKNDKDLNDTLVDENLPGFSSSQRMSNDGVKKDIDQEFLDDYPEDYDANEVKDFGYSHLEDVPTRKFKNDQDLKDTLVDEKLPETSSYQMMVSNDESSVNEIFQSVYDSDDRNYRVTGRSPSSLSHEQREKIHKEVVLPRAVEYLKQHGFNLDHFSSKYTIMRNVISADGKDYTVCAKGATNNELFIYPSEILERRRKENSNYWIFILCKNNCLFMPFDDIWKQKYTVNIQFDAKNYNTSDMNVFYDAIHYLKGSKFVFDLASVTPAHHRFNEIQNDIEKVDKEYVNNKTDSDEDF